MVMDSKSDEVIASNLNPEDGFDAVALNMASFSLLFGTMCISISHL